MKEALFTTVLLDVPRRIRFDNRARYKMSELDRPFELTDLGRQKKAFGAICAWLYACSYEQANAFASPAEVADVLPSDNSERMKEITDAIIEAVRMGLPSDAKAKNESAEKSHTQESNSA